MHLDSAHTDYSTVLESDRLRDARSLSPIHFVASSFNYSLVIALAIMSFFSVVIQSEDRAWLLRVIPLTLLAAAVILARRVPAKVNSARVRRIEGIMASGAFLMSIIAVDGSNRYPDLWPGFGLLPTMVILLAILVFTKSNFRHALDLPSQFTRSLPWLALVWYIPVFIQPTYGLLNLGDTTYHVLDELLAPSVGQVPYFDYSPQYTALFGWIIKPMSLIGLAPNVMMSCVMVACNLFNVLVVVVSVRIMKFIRPSTPVGALTFALIAVWCVSGPYNGSSIQLKEFATFGRYLPFVIVLWIFLSSASHLSFDRFDWRSASLGVALGLASINNSETGVVLIVAVLGSFIIPLLKGQTKLRRLVIMLVSLLSTLITYFGVFAMRLGRPTWQSLVGIRLGGSGLYEFSRPEIAGPHLISLAVAVAVLSLGIRHQLDLPRDDRLRATACLEVVMGLATLLLFFKYFFRPIPQSVPQFFIPVIISAFLLISGSKVVEQLSNQATSRPALSQLPLLALLFLPLGAMTQAPNAIDELKRITQDHSNETAWSSSPGRPSDGWSIKAINQANDNLFDVVKEISSVLDNESGQVMYFGIHGNAVELVTSVENGLGIPAPESIRYGGNQPELACLPLLRKQPQFVIVYRSEFPCSEYQMSPLLGQSEHFVLMERIR